MAEEFGLLGVKAVSDDVVYGRRGGRVVWDTLNFGVYESNGTVGNTSDLTFLQVQTPQTDYQAANKIYVDNKVDSLDNKQSVSFISTSTIGITSGTITLPTTTLNTYLDDGTVSVSDGNRILVASESGSLNVGDPENGIYTVSISGTNATLTRSEDTDDVNTIFKDLSAGMFVFVTEGNTYRDTGWVLITNDPITVGTTPLLFSQFAGGSLSGLLEGPGIDIYTIGSNEYVALDILSTTPLPTDNISPNDIIAFADVSDANTTKTTTLTDLLSNAPDSWGLFSLSTVSTQGHQTGDMMIDAANPDDEITLSAGVGIQLTGDNIAPSISIQLNYTADAVDNLLAPGTLADDDVFLVRDFDGGGEIKRTTLQAVKDYVGNGLQKLRGTINQTGIADTVVLEPNFTGIIQRVKVNNQTSWGDGTDYTFELSTNGVILSSQNPDFDEILTNCLQICELDLEVATSQSLSFSWDTGGTGILDYCIEYVTI